MYLPEQFHETRPDVLQQLIAEFPFATLVNVGPDGLPVATPVSHQDSSLLANLTRADALIIRPPHAPAASAGTPCRVLRLPG